MVNYGDIQNATVDRAITQRTINRDVPSGGRIAGLCVEPQEARNLRILDLEVQKATFCSLA